MAQRDKLADSSRTTRPNPESFYTVGHLENVINESQFDRNIKTLSGIMDYCGSSDNDD